ncbi:MAG: succinylglutamate desuccinylase/aspartoacylase family protein [Hyphomicrobiales bacterium]|nr:succinylglutamate desuccinylase/aspartoacylase family protein [Hyphomicrobiales bacterium]
MNVATETSERLTRLEGFPDALLEVPATELWRHLSGPTLISVPGRPQRPLFVSVLLHGNEDTGWRAIQSLLRDRKGGQLPRPLLLLVGNVAAARANERTLPGQEDHNRAWPGTPHPETSLAALLREVTEIARHARPFASIDIHNNTGHNPHYACVNALAESYLHLARLFSRTVVYFEKPVGVQSAALAHICPAVTVECGRAGDPAGVDHTAEFVAAALALRHFPDHPVPAHDLDLMRTFAIIKVPSDATFSSDGSEADFRFRADLDHLNFSELEAGAGFGRLGGSLRRHLEIAAGDDAAPPGEYFDYADNQIRLAQPAIPAMLTMDQTAVRLDCLGYLMHRIGRDGRRVA